MPVQVGVGYIDIRPDTSGFARDLKRDMSREMAVAGEAGGKALGDNLTKNLKKALAFGGVSLGAAMVGDFVKGAVSAASDLNEVLSKSNNVFRESSAQIEAWAEGGAEDFGLSKRAALEAASGFGNMFAQLGIGTQAAAGMSTRIVELAADFASFHNADISEVLAGQAAAFRGEYDSLQRFLPLINAATVEQRALELTGKKATKELTAQEKALAVNALMLEGAGDAAGDFDRTSESLANRMRTLGAESENTKAKLGDALAPALANIVGFLNDKAVPAFLWLIEVLGEGMADAVGFAIGALADLLSVLAKALEKIDQFTPGMEGVPERLKEAVAEMRSWEASAHNLQSTVDKTTGSVRDQGGAVGDLGEELKDLVTITLENTDAQRALDKATRTLGAANRDKATAQKELNELLAQGAIDEKKIADARKALASATRSAASADRQLSEAQETYDAALANANLLKGYDTAQDELADATLGLADAQANATDAHEAATEAAAELRAAQRGDPEFQDKLADARDRVADATDAIAEAEKDLAARSAEAVAAHDAERIAIGLKADEMARLRIEHEKLAALAALDPSITVDPGGASGSWTAPSVMVDPGGASGSWPTPQPFLNAAVNAAVTGSASTPPAGTVNNVTIAVTQTDPSPQKLAREIVWALQ